jgi:hypothetical protein
MAAASLRPQSVLVLLLLSPDWIAQINVAVAAISALIVRGPR